MRVKMTTTYIDNALYMRLIDDIRVSFKLNGRKIALEEGLTVIFKDGDVIKIDNQIKPWVAKLEKDGRLKFYHETFEERGYKVYENNVYLFAVTSNSARNGIFHKYKPAKNSLEQYLKESGISSKIIEYYDGRYIPSFRHEIGKFGVKGVSEVNVSVITNYGCPGHIDKETNVITIENADYIIVYSEYTKPNNKKYCLLDKILLTNNSDFNSIINRCKEIKKKCK